MVDSNSLARWGIFLAQRDGRPAITETVLWQLRATHPETYEERDGKRFLLLDRRYRLLDLPDRSFWLLVPDGEEAP